MATIHSLPSELLFNIFNKFNKLAYLTQCRLACRAWRDPAERAMLGHAITISRNWRKMDSIYNFLYSNRERIQLIKQLHFGAEHGMYGTINIDLLELVAASDIESITGHIWDADFLDVFMDVIESAPSNLAKLKTLTLSYGEAEPPLELALHCKKTIQTMKMNFFNYHDDNPWNFMNRLNEFPQLTSLTLTATFNSIEELNILMDNCLHLEELELEAWGNIGSEYDLDQHVGKIHQKLKTLKICDGNHTPLLIQYFLVKLANLEKISITVVVREHYVYEQEIIRVSKLMQEVPQQKELVYNVEMKTYVPDVVSCLENAGCTTTIENEDAQWDFRIRVNF